MNTDFLCVVEHALVFCCSRVGYGSFHFLTRAFHVCEYLQPNHLGFIAK